MQINNHSLRTILGLVVVFTIGAGQAYKSGFNLTDVIEMLVAGLLAVEHYLNGQTS